MERAPEEIRVAPYTLDVDANGTITEIHGKPFDKVAFSRLKFGSFADLKHFAREIVGALPLGSIDDNTIITSAAYTYTPTAGSLLARHVQTMLNAGRKNPLDILKLHTPPIDENYSSLSLEGRRAYLDRSPYHIDKELVRGKHILVVDDICVTGGHEEGVRRLLRKVKVAKITFAYVATMDTHGNTPIENQLNNMAVNSLDDLEKILSGEGAAITEKTCKYILGEQDLKKLEFFLVWVPENVVYRIYAAAVNNGYSQNSAYAPQIALLRTEMMRREEKLLE